MSILNVFFKRIERRNRNPRSILNYYYPPLPTIQEETRRELYEYDHERIRVVVPGQGIEPDREVSWSLSKAPVVRHILRAVKWVFRRKTHEIATAAPSTSSEGPSTFITTDEEGMRDIPQQEQRRSPKRKAESSPDPRRSPRLTGRRCVRRSNRILAKRQKLQ